LALPRAIFRAKPAGSDIQINRLKRTEEKALQNINTPGVFPAVIALLLTFAALRSHHNYVKRQNKGYKRSWLLCALGAAIYYAIAVFQLLESYGIWHK
jgi:hypothetical protein